MDFLILYEHFSREYENACLLKEELKRRGYSAKIECIYSIKRFLYQPKVLIVPHLYNDVQLEDFARSYYGNIDKIIDLQYEQVLSDAGFKEGYHVPKGKAKYAYHIAWGPDQYERYIAGGIAEENISITGSISMDLNHKKFNSIFLNRYEVAQMFKIPVEKKWRMFISSFTLNGRTEEEIKRFQKANNSVRILKDVMDSSKIEIIKWIEFALKEYKDEIFIYRPHPAEKNDSLLRSMEERYDNFFVISDFSIRQWARIIDNAYTWFSTSIVDFYYVENDCFVLRPITIPTEIDSVLFKNAKFVNDIIEFKNILKNDSQEFPISEEEIHKYYGFWKDGNAYKRVADTCEKMWKSPIMKEIKRDKSKISLKTGITFLCYEICKYIQLSKKMKKLIPNKYIAQFERAENEMFGKKEIIKEYQKRFKEIV